MELSLKFHGTFVPWNEITLELSRDYIVAKNPHRLSLEFVSRYPDIVDPAGSPVKMRREVRWEGENELADF